MKLKFYITLACLSLAIAGNTQKIGYLNSVKFIDTLQEAKLLADQLLQYEKSLSETGEKMISKFQEDLKLYQKDQQAGTLTPTAQKQKESDLQVRKLSSNIRKVLKNLWTSGDWSSLSLC